MEQDEIDQRRVRIGLAFLVIVVICASIGAFTIKSAVGQMVMLGIAGFTIIRTFMLMRTIKRDRS